MLFRSVKVPEPVAIVVPLDARTVKLMTPVGVAAVVVIVRVLVTVPLPVMLTEDGENEAVAPAGSTVVTLKLSN